MSQFPLLLTNKYTKFAALLDMFKNATIAERDSILLNRAVASGMLSTDAASYLCKIDSYLFRGMLADVSGRDLDDDDFRWVTRDFMNLLIRSYTTQLQEGFSIPIVKPDFDSEEAIRNSDDRSSYRVKIVSVSTGSTQQRKEKATA